MIPDNPVPVNPAGPALSCEQADIIRHSLGLTSASNVGKKRPKPYRNYYCTRDGNPELEALVTLGVMCRANALNDGRDRYYVVTEAGAKAVGSHLPKD